VTIDGFWIDLLDTRDTQLVTTLYKSVTQRLVCSSRSSLLCLIMFSNSGRSSASGLTSSQAGGHLTPTSYSSHCRLRTLLQSKSKSKLCYDRMPVVQSVLVPSPIGAQDQIFVTVRQLRVRWCEARGRICRLQLLLAFAISVILWSESCGTHDHILLSQIQDSPNLEGQVTVSISPRNRVAQLYPQTLGSIFVASCDS
jgi:hypothetical protein